MLFSGQDPMGSRVRKPCLLYHSWFELCPLGQGTFEISDSRGASPSPSPTPILRAPWMSTALRAEPTHCLAYERRDPHIPSPTFSSSSFPGPPGNLELCSLQLPRLPGRVWLATVPSQGRRQGTPLYVFPSPTGCFSCKSWSQGPSASLCGTRIVLEPPSRNQLQKAREQAVLLAVSALQGAGGRKKVWVELRPRALLWLEHCVTRFSRQSRW